MLAPDALAAPGDGPYDIMKPEPGTPGVVNPYKPPRRSHQHIERVPEPVPPARPRAYVPPPLVIPQTGQVVPSQPAPRGESFGDRATRCTHQAGIAGLPAGQRGAYMGSCLNQ